MKRCERCARDKLTRISLDDSVEISGHVFTAALPADRCAGCGQIVVQAEQIRRFELCVAVMLAKAGVRTGEAFAFMRQTLKMSPQGFAGLVDVPPDYVEYWETGRWPVDPRALAVLASMLVSKVEDRHAALDCLRVLRQPRQLARRVRLQLSDALSCAAKTLQLGSAAHTAPALA